MERRNHQLRKYHQERERAKKIKREREEEEYRIKEMETKQRKETNRLEVIQKIYLELS